MVVYLCITFLILLTVKHFFIDFMLQVPYYYKNKGTLGHLGGILHAVEHGIGTMIVLVMMCLFMPVHPLMILGLAILDSTIHYFMDWYKVKTCTENGWTATNSEEYWIWMGLDQFIHYMTYLLLAALLF